MENVHIYIPFQNLLYSSMFKKKKLTKDPALSVLVVL